MSHSDKETAQTTKKDFLYPRNRTSPDRALCSVGGSGASAGEVDKLSKVIGLLQDAHTKVAADAAVKVETFKNLFTMVF